MHVCAIVFLWSESLRWYPNASISLLKIRLPFYWKSYIMWFISWHNFLLFNATQSLCTLSNCRRWLLLLLSLHLWPASILWSCPLRTIAEDTLTSCSTWQTPSGPTLGTSSFHSLWKNILYGCRFVSLVSCYTHAKPLWFRCVSMYYESP